MARYLMSKKAKGVSYNEAWAKSVSFEEFKKETNVAKLSASKQKELYEQLTGKKPELKK